MLYELRTQSFFYLDDLNEMLTRIGQNCDDLERAYFMDDPGISHRGYFLNHTTLVDIELLCLSLILVLMFVFIYIIYMFYIEYFVMPQKSVNLLLYFSTLWSFFITVFVITLSSEYSVTNVRNREEVIEFKTS